MILTSLLRPLVRNCLLNCSIQILSKTYTSSIADIVQRKSDYFELFKQKQTFDVDVTSLKQEFLKLQSQLHPDKFATGSEDEKRDSLDASSHVNMAYQTLINAHSRGLYMLQLAGQEIPEEAVDMNLSQKFLEKMMEMNEKVSESSPEQVTEMILDVQIKLSKLKEELSQVFSTSNYQSAKELLVEYQFYSNALSRLKMKIV